MLLLPPPLHPCLGLQGGVDAVIEASAVVSGTSRKQAAASRKRSESGASDGAPPPPRSAAAAAAAAADVTAASMAAASSRVLSRLMTVEDVLNTVEEINEISASVKRGRLPGADALRPILSRIAHMSTVSNFAGTIATEGGATALTSVVRAILAKVRQWRGLGVVLLFVASLCLAGRRGTQR